MYVVTLGLIKGDADDSLNVATVTPVGEFAATKASLVKTAADPTDAVMTTFLPSHGVGKVTVADRVSGSLQPLLGALGKATVTGAVEPSAANPCKTQRY